MKKGEIYEGIIEKVDFPNKGYVNIDGEKVIVKNGIPGQKVRFMINKKRSGRAEGRLLEVLEKSPLEVREPVCKIFPACGGCMYQTMSYEEQLKMKETQVKGLLQEAVGIGTDLHWEGIHGSPIEFGYRNKMEFSFGDEYKDGPLSLVEAARIDGSGEFHTFNRIVIPIMKPAIAVQAIFTFVGSWNNYFVPALIIQSKSKMTVPILIATLRGADYMNFDMGKIYMMITVAIVPIIVVYLLLSKYIIAGVTLGGVKE